MIYHKVSSELTSSSPFLYVKNDQCLIPIFNTSFQIPNHETNPLFLQPSVKPLVLPLKKTFQRGKLKLHASEYTRYQLKLYASHPNKGFLLRMNLGYFWWIFHRLINRSPVSQGLAVSVFSMATPRLFGVSTIVRKGRRSALLTLLQHCVDGLMWRVFKFPSCRRGDSGPGNRGSSKI